MGYFYLKIFYKSSQRQIILSLICLAFLTYSCKKKKAFNEEDGQVTVDNRMTQGQCDAVAKEVNIAVMLQSNLRGRPSGEEKEGGKSGTTLCGLKVDSSNILNGIGRFIYDGMPCGETKKSGEVVFSILDYPLQKWKYQACVVKIDFQAYKSTRLSDGKSVQLDGTVYLTNVSGKTWYDLIYLNQPSLTQIMTGDNVKASFDGNNTAKFNFNRRMSYTYSKKDSVVTCTIEGLGSYNNDSDLENWGVTRDGAEFASVVSSPLVWKSSCASNVLQQGELVIKVSGKPFDLNCKFGVNSAGDDSEASNCAYGWKASWAYKKRDKSRVFAYN